MVCFITPVYRSLITRTDRTNFPIFSYFFTFFCNNNNICGALVYMQGLHGLVCKQAPSKIARHQAINDVVAHVISTSGTPVMKELVGLTRLL